MSPAQHTKGPWTLRAWTSEYGLDYFVDAKSGITAVARVLSAHMSGNPETQANARLIAAAPELLAALEETLRALEQHLDDDANAHGLKSRDFLCPCSTNEVVRARAAIAKAKGGT